MPNKKKNSKEKKKKQDARRQKQDNARNTKIHASTFREMILSARKEYAKGRSYAAVELQEEAIQYGIKNLPTFEEDSLVKGHVLVELALARSAILTDFATGDHHTKCKEEFSRDVLAARTIFENRVKAGTLNMWRREECWFSAGGEDYESPVPHPERMGANDYMTSVNLSNLISTTEEIVKMLQMAIGFLTMYKNNGCVVTLEAGASLQGELSPNLDFEKMKLMLEEHTAVMNGVKDKAEIDNSIFKVHFDGTQKEVRHRGTRDGTMKKTYKQLEKDVDRIGLKRCNRCGVEESQPRQFATCSRCGWALYCSKECQKADWKAHKPDCKKGEGEKQEKREKVQNDRDNCLMVGQSQQILKIVSLLHHFAAISDEMHRTDTQMAQIVTHMLAPQYEGVDLGCKMLGMKEASFCWMAIWSMCREDREKMMKRLVKKLKHYRFPKGTDADVVVKNWMIYGVAGDFAVVKHTPKGTIMLHEDEDGEIKGYCVVGITQPLEEILQQVPGALPQYINTGLIPFKKVTLCQGTLMPSMNTISGKLKNAANTYVNGEGSIRMVTNMTSE